LQKETQENEEEASILVPLYERDERVRQDLADRNIDTERAMVLIEALVRERAEAEAAARASGLDRRAFGLYWLLREDRVLAAAGIDPMAFASEVQTQLERYPNAAVDADEKRLLRRDLYKPLGAVPPAERKVLVDRSVALLFRG